MEEYPESEWEIQEYSSSNKGETSMMKWILNKGYGIGKKMMITGIAISAAPLVLPPILVFSAMGVAFSVPSGLVFATYACTNKLMRMLLPTPPSPVLLLEYYSDDDEHVKEEGIYDCGKYVGASITDLDENIIGDGLCNENEEEKVQIAGYEDEGEGLIMNVDENVDEMEIKDVVLPRENVIKDDEVEKMEDMKQEDETRLKVGVASISNSDEDEGFYDDDNKEEVQPYDYKQEKDVLLVNADEVVDEKSYDTNENDVKKEMDNDVLQSEKFTKEEEVELIKDMNHEVEMRLELDGASITNSNEIIVGEGLYEDDDNKEEEVHPYDYKQERDALVVNVDEVVDEQSYDTNENDDEKEMEDDVKRSQTVTKEEVEMRLELDVGSITNSDDNGVGKGHIEEEVRPDDHDQELEALIMYENEKSYNIDDVKAIEDDFLRRENFVEEEETEQMEDIKEGVEMRLGLDVESVKNTDENIVGEVLYDDVNKEEFQADDEIEDEKSNENDVENEMEDHVTKDYAGLIKSSNENIVEEGSWIKSSNKNIVEEGSCDDVNKEELRADDEIKDEKSNENSVDNEMEDRVLQTENDTKEAETEQMEDIKKEVDTRLGLDVGLITNFGGGGINEQGCAEDIGEYQQEDENENNTQEDEKEEVVEESNGLLEESASNVASGVETIEPVIVKEIECEKLIPNGSNDNERVGEMRHVVILTEGDEGNNFNSREVEELDLVAKKVAGDSKKDERNFESDEKVMRESMGTQEKTISDTVSNYGTERTNEENLITLNADARDDVGDDNAIINSEDLEAGDEVKENGADEDVDVLALPAFKRMVSDTHNREVKAENDTKLPTKEDILDDGKIWEKIGAMRAIVGYNVPKQPTCIEELKALYVFTGVEPPVSFNGDSGLDEVNEKLKFLMSIVGVK
ncbi:uncharacterized protein [Rutidosis leptorrhynchoides]|uniref:uncharacterized protein isoform X2 n=1 Tax=Rutidosis leptorrhynchoides TaxID=125765 RepID=UPI003A98DCDA